MIGAGLQVGACSRRAPDPPARPLPPATAASNEPLAGAEPAVASGDSVADPTPGGQEALPIVPASAVSPPPSHPQLEEVVAQVLPAIVQIETRTGRGTGFFVRVDTVVTNVHVIGSDLSVTVRRADHSTTPARVHASSPAHDLALLKVDAVDPKQTTLPLASVLGLRVGQDVLAIGSALGTLQNTVTRGIVSAVRQSGAAILVQTDAAVNPGNSGGPLLDRHGTVVGITTMGYADRQGLNFAVAADHARALLDGRPAAVTSRDEVPHVVPRLPSDSDTSDTDKTRAAGSARYDQAVRRLAEQADAIDDYWQRYRTSCRQRGTGGHSREWFALLESVVVEGSLVPGCAEWLTDLRQRASTLERAQLEADEAARRSDVYPGTRRDIRRRHRLDFVGWDR